MSSTNHGECALVMSEAYRGQVATSHDHQEQWSIIAAATYYDLPPMLDRVGVWAICVDGLYCLINNCAISSDRFDEMDWVDHMSEKDWIDETEFAAAFELARTLKGLGYLH
jgi:hypothetical protein